MKKFHFLKRGFSLTEVTIALGLVAFGLIALFALLPTGLNLVKESSDEGVAVNILTGLASDLKNSDGSASTAVHDIPIANAGTGSLYFDETGRFLGNSLSQNAIYKATWAVRSRDASNGVPPNAHLFVSWPAAAQKPIGFVEALVVLKNNPGNS